MGSRRAASEPGVVVVLPQLRVNEVFAGVATAVEFGAQIASRADRPLRIVVLDHPVRRSVEPSLRARVAQLAGTTVHIDWIIDAGEIESVGFNRDDAWIVTYWTTAHAVSIASEYEYIDPSNVIHLIQDFEPGFLPWGAEYVLARAVFDMPFTRVVNSMPLRDFCAKKAIDIDARYVFAPSLDLARLEAVARARQEDEQVRVLFYGRPSKPRNLFSLGVAALRSAAPTLRDQGAVSFVSAGESHKPTNLGDALTMNSLGALSLEKYFDLLARVDLVLALQFSPHPSHMPLDAVVSGAVGVTNEFADTRRNMHQRLIVAETDAEALASSLAEAALIARGREHSAFDGDFIARLGRPLADVTNDVVASVKPFIEV